MESAVTAPVSGHIKRVVVQEGKFRTIMMVKSVSQLCFFFHLSGDSINQGDLTVEIVH